MCKRYNALSHTHRAKASIAFWIHFIIWITKEWKKTGCWVKSTNGLIHVEVLPFYQFNNKEILSINTKKNASMFMDDICVCVFLNVQYIVFLFKCKVWFLLTNLLKVYAIIFQLFSKLSFVAVNSIKMDVIFA